MAVKAIDKGLAAHARLAKAINGRGVEFGIQRDAGRDPKTGIELIDIAIWNELGTEHIPARPAIRDFAEKNGEVLGMAMERMAGSVQDGSLTVEQALDQLGTFAEKHQKAHIQHSKEWAKPNAKSTVAKKGSDVPLIDHGLLVNAVRYQKV